MKKILLVFTGIMLIAFCSYAQQNAITDTGDRVVLYSDGTWIYANKDSLKIEDIPSNNNPFTKRPDASFLVKSKRINVGFWLNPDIWTFESPGGTDAAEFELDHQSGSLYGLIITENLNIPLTSLGNIALQNAREAAPDIKVTSKEYRVVNGITVLMLRMTGTIQDIRFSYYGYYYAADGGSTQFLVYTSEAFMEENLPVVEDLLNGFVRLEK